MIPLSNREKLIKLLEQGMDIRAACKEAKITRSNLYKYFKQMHGFRDEVDATVKKVLDRAVDIQKKIDEENMRKIKEIIQRR